MATTLFEKDISRIILGLAYFREGDANAFFTPAIGISNQPSANILNTFLQSEGNQLQRSWNPFYIFQFRLNEEHFGFAFTGEVRGFIQRNSPPSV